MRSLGDFDAATILYGKFTTYRPSTGAPFTLAGTPALAIYKDASTIQSTAGVTLTVDFDTVTGLNHYAIDTSADGTFYSAGSFFDLVLTAGTVDSVSAVGTVVASFTLRKTAAVKPTIAGRTLDISATGEAGVDWANVGSPTTTVGLSGTTVSSTQVVAQVSGSIGLVATGGIATGSIAAGAIDAAAIAAGAITSSEAPALANLDAAVSTRLATAGYTVPLDAAGTRTALGLAAANLDTQLSGIQGDTNDLQARVPATLVAGRMDASLGAINGATTPALNLERSATALYRGAITGASTTTTLVDNGLTQSAANHWQGRVVIFTSGVLALQATVITGFTPATDTLVVTALTGAPSVSDQYVIV
jgi:hypothetical protein